MSADVASAPVATGRILGETGLESIAISLDRRLPVGDQIHEVLRRAIVEVRIAPGTPISENTVCGLFSVSRTPVRAAIGRLADEGLVAVFPQIGSFVAPIRLAGLLDSHFIRRSLEISILREVAPKWTREMSAAVRQAVVDLERAIAEGDADGFFRADEAFHHLLCTFTGREGVWQAIAAAKVALTRFHRYGARTDRLPNVVREHNAIIDALDRGDAAAAERALASHLDMVFVLFEQMSEDERRQLGR
jgi:DNA-binding GntR family transcriptional regulator